MNIYLSFLNSLLLFLIMQSFNIYIYINSNTFYIQILTYTYTFLSILFNTDKIININKIFLQLYYV